MLDGLTVTIAYQRILLIDWTHPGPIADYLLPNSIDWTTDSFDRTFITDGPLMGKRHRTDCRAKQLAHQRVKLCCCRAT